MPTLAFPALLTAWEAASAHRPAERALSLIAAAAGGMPAEAGLLSVGARDTRLLKMREELFGRTLTGLAGCPACGETVELACDAAALRVSPSVVDTNDCIAVGDYRARVRPPNGADLAAIEVAGGVDAAVRLLLQRCVLWAERNGIPAEADDLPPEMVATIARRLAELDPQADLELSLTCPSCGQPWQATFDIASFLWSELDAWGQRTLDEVHALASAYGWGEADILRMSPRRRQSYLMRVGPWSTS